MSLFIMRNLTKRLRLADRNIESLALLDVYGRVARLLLEAAETVDGRLVVMHKMSKQDIAKMIGASREMVSRVMRDLTAQGLIQEADGQANALLEDLLILGAGDQVTCQLGGPLLVQPALGGRNRRPVLVQAGAHGVREVPPRAGLAVLEIVL